MNRNDFETQLRRLQPKQPPEDLKRSVLRAARLELPSTETSSQNTFLAWLHGVLWPNPTAWATLAAIWVLGLLVAASNVEPLGSAKLATAPSKAELKLAQEQKAIIYNELGITMPVTAGRPVNAPHDPVEHRNPRKDAFEDGSNSNLNPIAIV